MARYTLLIFSLTIAPMSLGFGQEILKQMTAGELKDPEQFIHVKPGQAVLVVRSIIKGLQFQSNLIIDSTREVSNGEWWLYLSTEMYMFDQIITFSAPQFQSIDKRVVFAENGRVKEIEIKPVDAEPPQLNPIRPNGPIREQTKAVFRANVKDNVGVKDVTLIYRFKGKVETDYEPKRMDPVGPDLFETEVVAQPDTVFYYFEATDISGNGTSIGTKDRPGPPLIVTRIFFRNQRKKWLLLGGAGLAVTGIATAIILTGGESPPPNVFPPPPGRP